MSRAEPRVVPAAPRLRRVFREAASDLYYNSWRFLAANLLIGGVLVLILLASVGAAVSLVLLVVVAVPCAGMMRMATTLVRDGHTDFGEVWAIVRRPWLPLGLGAIQLLLALVLVADIAIGAAWSSPLGGFLTASAVYGALIGWAYVVTVWPLLLDPIRDSEPVTRRLRLAALLLLAHPLRIGLFALILGLITIASGVAIMPILTFALAYAWLVAARYVLPAADRLEGRATHEVAD